MCSSDLGMEILKLASDEYNYNLHMPSIAQIWKGGCIIRSTLLKRIQDAYNLDSQLPNLLIDPWFASQVTRRLPGLTRVVSVANQEGIPVPLMRVSGGLDSLVLGEGQILSQVKKMVRLGQENQSLGPIFNRLLTQAVSTGKRVRSETNLGTGAVSISSAAVELAQLKHIN